MPRAVRARIGAHVSVAGGLGTALTRAEGLGAEVIQVFVANPRGWAPPTPDPQGDARFADAARTADLQVFVHAPYLINLGSTAPATVTRSAAALAFSLRRAGAIGARGVVMHAGSAVGQPWVAAMAQLRDELLRILDRSPGVPVLVEPTAGGGGALAHDAASLADYLDAIGRDERVAVCLDTCHMHAAGHDLSSIDGFRSALRAYRRAVGPGGVPLVHVNDSRDPAGSRRDRHESVGHGSIGCEPFGALFELPLTRDSALVVETAEADHAADIATLKELRASR